MLGLIDMRLRQAIPESKNESFGGRSIIMFRDFGQIPPVLDFPMYTNDTSYSTASKNSLSAYKYFKEAYKLNVVQRQSGKSYEQRNFRDILLRLREGKSSLNDWRNLTRRFEENLHW